VAGIWSGGPFLLVETANQGNLQASRGHGSLPHHCAKTGRVIAFWGRLDERASVAAQLGISASAPDEDLVLAAHERWSSSCPEKLHGDYAGVIWDPNSSRVFLFRDRLGTRPLYYQLHPSFLAFATTAAVFPHLLQHSPSPDPEWVARSLTGDFHAATSTGWKEVVKLAPGHTLEVRSPGTTASLSRYHRWRDDPPWTIERHTHQVAEYRMMLEEAIHCRVGGAVPLGSENSGGLDSATIIAYLSRCLEDASEQLHTFSFALFEDEPRFIAKVNEWAGVDRSASFSLQRPLMDEDIARGIAAVGYPEDQRSASFHIPFFIECQRRGIRTLFSGFGGDEAVTSSGHLLGRELLDHRAYAELWRLVPGSAPARAMRVMQARVHRRTWGAGHSGLRKSMETRRHHLLVKSEYMRRFGLLDEYLRAAEYDAPYRRVNEFLIEDRLAPWVARRLETSTLVAATYGVEYTWPLLDARLIQLYLSTPSIEKASQVGGRYLHRRAVEGVLPQEVVWKEKSMGASISPISNRGLAGYPNQESLLHEARRIEGHLHPLLEDVVDLPRFRRQITATTDGHLNQSERNQFARNVNRLRWLDRWLSGEAPPG
jgi:asparagine synthase (glutamine-hydrolysing)